MSREEMVRVHLWLYREDLDRIRKYFGDSIGPSKAARLMIRKFLDNMESTLEPETRRPSALNPTPTGLSAKPLPTVGGEGGLPRGADGKGPPESE